MFKNSQKQNGSTHVVIVIVLVLALVDALGFIFWQNFINRDVAPKNQTADTPSKQDDSAKKPAETPAYTLDNAVGDINKVLQGKGCDGSGIKDPVATDMFRTVTDSDQFSYKGGMSTINTGLSYAYVQYGCGSQGSTSLLKRVGDAWSLISEDARIYPMCARVEGQGFPVSIIDKCYPNDQATEPVTIKS